LAEATVAHKATGDSPGLETGAMRASIECSDVYGHHGHWEIAVGTNDPHAVWFELGTVKQPPRSFLMRAAVHKTEEIKTICGRDVFVSALSTKAPDSGSD
jgi:hypothetical protein